MGMLQAQSRERSLLLLMVTQLSTGFSMGIIEPILSLYVRSRGLTIMEVGLLGTASMLGWFVFEPIMGVVADSVRKRTMMVVAIIGATVIYAMYPFATTLTHFALLGFARSSVMSAYSIPVKALTAELLPSQDRGRAYGRFMTVVGLGGMIAPLIGGFISQASGYLVPFYASAAVGLVGLAAILIMRHDDRPQEGGAALRRWRDILTAPMLSVFSVRGIFFVNSGFRSSFLPIYLNESPLFNASEAQIGAFFTLVRLSGAVSRSMIGDLCDRLGNRLMIVASVAVLGVSYGALLIGGGVWVMYAIALVQGVSMAAADTGMMLHLISVMPAGRTGVVMGMYSEAENIGGLISTPTLGYLYENIGAGSSLTVVATVMCLNALLAYLVIRKKEG
ncbi:MAG TPA: MFS transporter [Candidatus Desulfaltia sp.]|nr:MFS transporter [Candidatus Desulfaltia sp.]